VSLLLQYLLQREAEEDPPLSLSLFNDNTRPAAAGPGVCVCVCRRERFIRKVELSHNSEGRGQGQARSKGRGSPKSMSSMLIETIGRFQRQEAVPGESEGDRDIDFDWCSDDLNHATEA